VPIFDQNDYDLAFGNATFSKEFSMNSNKSIVYIDFNILVDSILRINRLGKFNIPDRKGLSVHIKGDNEQENFLLINLRRNYYKILDNLFMNLEPEDEYFLLCQKNDGANSMFYSTRFVLSNDILIEPLYQTYTYSELRKAISVNLRK
jgi:hypothetical protein